MGPRAESDVEGGRGAELVARDDRAGLELDVSAVAPRDAPRGWPDRPRRRREHGWASRRAERTARTSARSGRRDAWPAVGDGDGLAGVAPPHGHAHRAAFGRELRGVVEELTDRADSRRRRRSAGAGPRASCSTTRCAARPVCSARRDRAWRTVEEVVLAVEELHPPGLEPGHVDQVVERRPQAPHGSRPSRAAPSAGACETSPSSSSTSMRRYPTMGVSGVASSWEMLR